MISQRISGYVIIGLLILVGVFGFLYQGERVKTQALKTEIANINKDHAKEQADLIVEVATLNQKNRDREVFWQKEVTVAQQKHKEELNAIETRYLTNLAANNRLRDTVKTLNRKLSNYSRETVEGYAKTAANNLSECSSVTGELERLAYQYNSEIEFLLASWPSNDVGSGDNQDNNISDTRGNSENTTGSRTETRTMEVTN